MFKIRFALHSFTFSDYSDRKVRVALIVCLELHIDRFKTFKTLKYINS